jgi:hypothetical protein
VFKLQSLLLRFRQTVPARISPGLISSAPYSSSKMPRPGSHLARLNKQRSLFVALLTPGAFLQVTKTATHFFSFMRAYFLKLSFPAARHLLPSAMSGVKPHPLNKSLY